MIKRYNRTPLAVIPNNAEGKEFLRLLKKYRVKGTTIHRRGRHSDRKTLKKQGKMHKEVPVNLAERWGIYVVGKARSNFFLF